MVYQIEDVRAAVRGKVQGIPVSVYSDDRLDIDITQAKRRLDADRPRYVAGTISGSGSKWYALSLLSEWVPDFSAINQIFYPSPVVANDDDVTVLPSYSFRAPVLLAAGEYLYVPDTLENGKTALVEYSCPWAITGVEGEVTTTLSTRYQNALEFLAASMTCEALSAKSAGTLDEQWPGEMVNWRNKYQEYQTVALLFRKEYYKELGMDPEKPPAMAVRGAYPSLDQLGRSWMTHRRSLPGSRVI